MTPKLPPVEVLAPLAQPKRHRDLWEEILRRQGPGCRTSKRRLHVISQPVSSDDAQLRWEIVPGFRLVERD
jgi:hypothetical protein